MLTNADLVELTALRRALHQAPERSGQEQRTAAAILAATRTAAPDTVLTGLGGHGVALVFNGQAPGPTVMIRAELDALPILERPLHGHGSTIPGVAHLCGHEGHSTILVGLARLLGRARPDRGRAILMFQPAEEDGSGAAAVIADPRFGGITPDWAFALHNLPGLPLGQVVLQEGPANCASQGIKITLTGHESHAAQPERGLSPAVAIAALIPALMAIGPGGPAGPDLRLVTVTHVQLGQPAFGITPGQGSVWATLRTLTDDRMASLVADVTAIATETARAHGLTLALSMHDAFAACSNDPAATAHLRGAIAAENIPLIPGDMPLRASEDFGRFGTTARSAMFYIGAGETHAALHSP
jgi:amidohydrolase